MKQSDEWLLFLEEVETTKKELGLGKNEECFYRGHTSVAYKLQPGIFRALKKQEYNYTLYEKEYDMYFEFRARAKEVHEHNMGDWDVLFFMQHHLAKTRLLDWTESFAIAIYFATLNLEASSTPCIWMLNPYKLNKKYHDVDDLFDPEYLDYYGGLKTPRSYRDYLEIHSTKAFPWDEPVAIYPIRRVQRLITQGGYFTVHGNKVKPIEELIKEKENIYRRIDIPKKALSDAKRFLEQAGINHYSVFPDLDGLAKYLNSKYFN